MGLSPSRITKAVEFLEAYAIRTMSELEEVVAPQGRPTDTEAYLDSNAYSETTQTDHAYTLMADAATAYREAGQWMMLMDPIDAARLLAESGRLYYRLGHPFGLYLNAVAGTWRDAKPPREQFGNAIAVLGRVLFGQDSEGQNTGDFGGTPANYLTTSDL